MSRVDEGILGAPRQGNPREGKGSDVTRRCCVIKEKEVDNVTESDESLARRMTLRCERDDVTVSDVAEMMFRCRGDEDVSSAGNCVAVAADRVWR